MHRRRIARAHARSAPGGEPAGRVETDARTAGDGRSFAQRRRSEKRMGRKANERVLAYTGSHRGRNGMPRSCPIIPRARAH
ncbi:hypothetical protein CWD85_00860 [Burkholderia pseudomallei]|nr:hypothetical protein CWD85_00860 [Burkholderia pseudomallei]